MPAKAKMTQEEADARFEALEKERTERGGTEAYDPDADDRDEGTTSRTVETPEGVHYRIPHAAPWRTGQKM